jgi:hypothetical protein
MGRKEEILIGFVEVVMSDTNREFFEKSFLK